MPSRDLARPEQTRGGMPQIRAWRWLAREIARRRQARTQWRELQLLDQTAFRDLGLDRSELGSYEAEATGTANRTRRRVSTWKSC